MKNLYEESYFQTRFSDAAGRDHVWKVIAEYLSQFIPSNGTVLDLGAGYCSFINNVKAAHKVAVDVYPEFKLRASPDVATEVRSCTDLSCFSNNQFDVVFSSNLLEHLEFEDVQKTLREAKRILKETGRLILLQPNFYYAYRNYFDDFTHRQIFTHKGVSDLLRSHGFRIEHSEPRFLPFSFKSSLPTWPWLVKLYLALPYRPFAKQMLLVALRPHVEQ